MCVSLSFKVGYWLLLISQFYGSDALLSVTSFGRPWLLVTTTIISIMMVS